MDDETLIVVQPSSYCNLDCRYCYVPNRQEVGCMSEHLLEEIIKKILRSRCVKNNVRFLWHAGEPLSLGIAFYERALSLQERYNGQSRGIHNCIQTNGLLITDQWIEFLHRNRFSIGISVDGPDFLHDSMRVSRQGK